MAWLSLENHFIPLSCPTLSDDKLVTTKLYQGFPGGSSGKEPACQCRFNPWVGKILLRRAWQSTPVFLPGESQGQRSLAGCSPWGRTESDTTEATWHTQPLPNLNYTSAFSDINIVSLKMETRVTGPFHFKKGRSPEGGNGNPLQYSCLENSLDRGTWQATIHGVAKSLSQT